MMHCLLNNYTMEKLFKCLRQYLVKNDNGNNFYKKNNDVLDELKNFEYEKMTFTNSKESILDFSKSSMFLNNDPFEVMVKYTKRPNFKPITNEEKKLLQSIDTLITTENKGVQSLKVAMFSGLSNTRYDVDYETLEKYGNTLIPRVKWNKNQKNYYGFETDDDYLYLTSEIRNSKLIKTAVHHKWTDRYYFINDDLSHRLAALYRQDKNQNRNTILDLKLCEKELNIECVKVIFENYFGIITTGKTYSFLKNKLESINIKILLEYNSIENDKLYILWIEKKQDELLSSVVNYISLLPSDKCYLVNSVLEKYI